VHELNELGWISAVMDHVYDLAPLLPETSTVGEFVKALFGYTASPALTETLAYLTYFVVVLGLLCYLDRKPVKQAAAPSV